MQQFVWLVTQSCPTTCMTSQSNVTQSCPTTCMTSQSNVTQSCPTTCMTSQSNVCLETRGKSDPLSSLRNIFTGCQWNGLDCRIPSHLFASHWIWMVPSISLCFVLWNIQRNADKWQCILKLLHKMVQASELFKGMLKRKPQEWKLVIRGRAAGGRAVGGREGRMQHSHQNMLF